MAASGSGNAWTNDLTLPGWFLFRQPAASPVAISSYNADTGAANTGSFLSYGTSGDSDRALGGLGSGGSYFDSPASGSVAGWFALALSNVSGSAISSLNVSFNGEQWRNGGNTTAQTMVLEYGYGTSFDQVASWVAPGGSFNWTSPVATGTAAAVDGNTAGRVENRGGTLDLTAIPWAEDATLWLRWTEVNDPGSDHGLAIDDLAIAIPQLPALPEVAIQAIVAQASESGGTASVRISRTGSTKDALTVPISLRSGAGLATNDDLTTPLPASVVIPAGSTSIDLAIEVRDDDLDEGSEILAIEITAPSGYALAASGALAEITILDNDRITPISAVQGSGSASPLVGQSVTLRAVVVGDFQLSGELGGFFLQEETSDWDTSDLSSEGLYVAYPLTGSNVDVVLGDRVLVSGLVSESFGQTILSSVQSLTVEAQGRLADTRPVEIPDLLAQRSTALDLEPYEGMWVRFPEILSVNGLYGQFRFGEIELSAGGLPLQPTNVMEPGPAAYAAEQATALRELVLDDGSNSSYRPASAATPAAPVRDQLLRRGDTVRDLEGVLAYGFSKYRLHPTALPNFITENPRPAAPAPALPGQLRLASFNVLNTFTTVDAPGATTATGLDPRGADTPEELERQLSKLTAALQGLQADVIGLMELENDSDDATLAAIVAKLNEAQPTDSGRSYSYVPTGLIGSDAIKVGLIYNTLAVAPSGAFQVLDTPNFTDPLASGTPKNRPALAQTFRDLASGETVNVVVNHLKSKGATGAASADLDQQDGQSAFNATRTAAASELLQWINSDPTSSGDADWVVLGDINAYAKEDPIRVFEAAGYRNALPSFTAEPPSSYAFFNPVDMSGALDHLLISPSLVPQVTAALDWSINAAEGAFRNYNLDTNSNGNAAVRDFFAPDPYRTSDHDPLLLDLALGRAVPSGLSFSHGVASGDPYADSVILWTRITPPAEFSGLVDVQWEVASSADFSADSLIDSGVFTTSAGRDWTVKVEADGLAADTSYYYRFRAGGAVSMVGQTKTLPVGSDPVRLAVFSCANFTAAEQFAAYGRAAAIHAVNPYDALLHLGDYIYEYGPGGYGTAEDAAADRGFLPEREIISLDDYRQRYAQYHTDSNLQNLRAIAPLIAGWDDHETANNSWSGGAENHQSETEGDWLARRDAALRAYYEWLPIREPGQRQASDGATALSPLTQAYRSFNFGDVLSLHMLETRLTARDEQLAYPDAAAVQARIGAILADPAQVATYAAQLGLTPPADPAAIPAFAAALAPAVTQELVAATVQQAWGDPSRDMIGDGQLAWLQQQLATSTAAWQVLGQQTLMQSMAVPAELLLNPGDPSLLDKYAAPLQKLATGTSFADLTPAEQALFDEAGKIPYNLDAWDGYGVERETILQSALALGKRLISLNGDTHNAWAGVLDTISPGPGTQPPGTVAGVEFGTPGVTSPGLERILPGADAYIRAVYPAVDGLDGLFTGYVNGLSYADTNRRGFLDLTVSTDEAVGTFVFLDGVNSFSGLPLWASETVVAAGDLSLSLTPEVTPEISWQPLWRELDLVFGLAVDATGGLSLLNPTDFATLPRAGVQLADVTVLGSESGERIFAGVDSLIDAAGGNDELFNTDSQGGNILVGGLGTDQFLLRAANDTVIGGSLLANTAALGLPAVVGLVDGQRDLLLIDSSIPAPEGTLRILDFELGRDQLLVDGLAPTGSWTAIRQQLQALGITVNAAPQLDTPLIALSLQPGVELSRDLGSLASDPDGNPLQLVKLEGPSWITTSGTTVKATAPIGISEEQLAALTLQLAFSDGQAAVPLAAQLTLNAPPTALSLTNTIASLAENTSTTSRIKVADIAISDDALGSNVITLAGADAASFEVIGNELFLKAGTALDFETKTSYAVSVSASDPSLPDSAPVSAAFSLAVTDVNEPPTSSGINNIEASENDPPITINLLSAFTDPDQVDSSLSYSVTRNSNPQLVGTTIDPITGSLAISLGQSKTGTALITVQATDSQLQSASADFSVSVLPFDANNDGIADKDQANVLAVATPGQDFVTFVSEAGGPTPTVGSTPNPAPESTPAGLLFSEGFFTVNYEGLTPGASTTLKLFLPSGSPTNSYWKYGPTSPGGASEWYNFSFDPISGTGARFEDLNGDGQDDIVLHFVDGQRGDDDFIANGRISDPGAPTFDPTAVKEPVRPVDPDPKPSEPVAPVTPVTPPQPLQPPGFPQSPQPDRPSKIRATEGRDNLTGTSARDTFIFQGVQSNSTKRRLKFDTITNFESNDRIAFRDFNERVLGSSNSSRIRRLQGKANKLSAKSLDKLLGPDFKGQTVAALEIRGFEGTFLAVNGGRRKVEGGRPGFDRRDMLIFLEGYDLEQQGSILLA
ncbi:MAG: ExeM/NucH family extracellular endonuclease [Cyanobium sp. M30B3]|nr:MAG: ExeM/NucH family extracellular endonuclease [Cyanobium sp. M30B3]